ncbi:MAG: DinB family protein [Vicinamibacterales bacterium]
MAPNEVERFIDVWEREAEKTANLLRALPREKYDFRPDPDGRSLGELAWHLAEGDAYITHGIELGQFAPEVKPPGIERPRQVQELAPGFERIHRDAVGRVRKLTPEDLDRSLSFFNLGPMSVRDLLWNLVLLHGIHHRGQLVLMCRLAGGRPTGVYGPTREEMPVPKPKSVSVAN